MRWYLLVFISILFTSCVWLPEKDYSSIKEKSTYSTFSDIENPMILSDSIYLQFKKSDADDNAKKISRCIGAVYSIYDFETDTIKDFVFSKLVANPSGKLQKLITSSGKIKFLGYNYAESKMFIMSPETNELEYIDIGQMRNYYSRSEDSDIYKYKLFYTTGRLEEETNSCVNTFRFYNVDANVFGKEINFKNAYNERVHTPEFVPKEKGGDGYLWFFTRDRQDYPKRDRYFLNRVNPETEEVETELITYDGVSGDEVYDWNTSKSWNHKVSYIVMDSTGDEILVYKNHSIVCDDNFAEMILINKNTFEIRKISEGLSYVGKIDGKYWFLDEKSYLVAYDVYTLEKLQIGGEEGIKFNKHDFYIQNNVIYVFDKALENDAYTTRIIKAFDVIKQEFTETRRIEKSRLISAN